MYARVDASHEHSLFSLAANRDAPPRDLIAQACKSNLRQAYVVLVVPF